MNFKCWQVVGKPCCKAVQLALIPEFVANYCLYATAILLLQQTWQPWKCVSLQSSNLTSCWLLLESHLPQLTHLSEPGITENLWVHKAIAAVADAAVYGMTLLKCGRLKAANATSKALLLASALCWAVLWASWWFMVIASRCSINSASSLPGVMVICIWSPVGEL